MAAGILAIGFMLIAMVFPVGIKLTASATEKTIGVIAAKEAEAKLKLYADDPLTIDFSPANKKFGVDGPTGLNELMLFEDIVDGASIFFTEYHNIYNGTVDVDVVRERFYEMLYPSLDYCDPKHYNPNPPDELKFRTHTNQASYRWTALCVETGNLNEIKTLILVTRKISKNAKFPVPQWDYTDPDYGYIDTSLVLTPDTYPYPKPQYWPMPIRVDLICVDYNLRIWAIDTSVDSNAGRYINKGDIIIDSLYDPSLPTNKIEHFQVVDEDRHGITLDGDFNRPGVTFTPGITTVTVWVVPPAVGSSRSPLVGVYSGGPIVFN
jgi:hypothetical protein